MSLALFLLVATIVCGLAGLWLLSSDLIEAFAEQGRQVRLYEAERAARELILKGAPPAADDLNIVPLPSPLQTYSAAAVIDAVVRAQPSKAEFARLQLVVNRSRPWQTRLRTFLRYPQGSKLKIEDLVSELLSMLVELDLREVVPESRQFIRPLIGLALTAFAILLALPSFLLSEQQQQRDQAAIAKLVGEIFSADASQRIENLLKPAPSEVVIVYVPMIGEGYARQLRTIFDNSGWQAVVSPSVLAPASGDVTAVVLDVSSKEDAARIAAALDAVNAPYTVEFDIGPTKVQELSLSLPEASG